MDKGSEEIKNVTKRSLNKLKKAVDLNALLDCFFELPSKWTKVSIYKCPFHESKAKTLVVFNNKYHCFECGASGDAIEFIMVYKKMGFIEAIEYLAHFLLKVDFPVLLGFIAGVTNLIPFIGPFIGAVPAALAALFISPLKALLVIILFIAIQQLDSYVISPNIMKFQVGVHPAVVIIVLIAAGAVFGPIGLLIAVPLTAMVQSVLKYYLLERRHSRSR